MTITPSGTFIFHQSDGSRYILGEESVRVYLKLRKQNKIVSPMNPKTGHFVHKDDRGNIYVYTALLII